MAAEKGSAEKGSGRFVVDRTLIAAGTEIKSGEYDVKWESHGQEVTVEFTPIGKSQGVKVQGKIVEVNKKFDSNNLGIAKDPSGREVIKELQFSGKKIKIVFE
jgi:glycine cleavage system H lipoate-binding protein